MPRPPDDVDLHPANWAWKTPALTVPCPWCRAAAGEVCTRWAPGGRRVPTRAPHPSRVDRLADADTGVDADAPAAIVGASRGADPPHPPTRPDWKESNRG